MKRYATTALSVLAAMLATAGFAQNVTVDSQQNRLLLAAVSTMTLQQELDKAGALGFHPVFGTTRGNGEMVVLLERTLGSSQKYQLHLIATSATETFQKEIGEKAVAGFRAVGRTFLNKGGEIVVVMERPVGPSTARPVGYKLLATNQTSTLEKEWISATTEKYVPIGILTRTEVMLLLER